MNVNPPSAIVSLLIVLTLFFGGGFAGEQLALVLAPGSGLLRLLGFLVLPAALIIGFYFWAGAAILVLIKRLAKGSLRSNQKNNEIPPGSQGFLWSSILACLVVGVLTGFLSQAHGFFLVSCAYVAIGLVYGTLCWQLAKSGWLQFPRE